MSQVVKLKRTAVEGKVPSTNNIELGELAINTYDGRIFFEKDNGTPSIQQVVTTNSDTTGSLNIQGNVTASYFFGDGSGLTNLPASDVSQVVTVTASFQETSSISVNHNFASRNVIVSVYDSSYSQLIPTSVVLTDNNNVDITLSGPNSGFAVVAKGGHIVSGTLVQEVSEVFTVTASFDNQSTIAVTHNFESKNVIVSVYDSNDSQLIPQSVTLTNLNTATIVLSANHSGFVVVAKGGHLVSGSAITSYSNLTNKPSGLVSGSSQLTSSYDIRYALSGSVGGGSTDISSLNSFTSSIQTRVDGLSSQTASLATTGSNTFTGTQTLNGSIIPAIDNTYDLGSVTYQWRDIYVSSGSLYIDGTKVLGSTGNELQITTDVGQSIKILEAGSDSIILQSADGDIQLKSSGGGNLLFDPTNGLIDVRGTLQIQDGNKVTSSGGNTIQFGNDLGITGSISTTGNINGINISTFSSSLSNQITSIQNSTSSTEERWTMFFTYTSSNDTTNTTQNNRLTSLETKSGSVESSISNINSFTSSNGNTALNDYTSSLKTALSVSGQNVTINGNFTVSGTQTIVDSTTVQIGDNIIELNGSGAANGGIQVKDVTIPNTATGSLIWDSTNDYWKAGIKDSEVKILLANGDNVVSGSSQVVGILSSLNTYTGSNDTTNTTQNSRLTALESTTGSYETQGRGIVSGSSQVISILSSLNTYTGSNDTTNTTQNSRLDQLSTYTSSNDTTNTTQNSRLTSIESATGSYETKGSGIVSGSSQVSYTGLSSIPSGIVSGSSQITLSSTSGYGSVINQAVLTSSSPTFAGGSFTGGISIASTTTIGGIDGSFLRTYSATNDTLRWALVNNSSGVFSIQQQGDNWADQGDRLIINRSGAITTASHITSGGWFGAPNGYGVTATNAAGNAGRILIKLNSSNQIEIGNDSDISAIKLGTASTGDAVTIASNGGTTINSSASTVLSTKSTTTDARIDIGHSGNGGFIGYANLGAGNAANTFYVSTGAGTPTSGIRMDNGGNVIVAGTLTENSSIRYKENIETIESGLEKVTQLRGVTYTKKDSGEKEMGLIAEEVYDVLPEVVLKNEEGEPDSVSYGRIVGVLIEGMKEQQKQIQELKLEIELLKQR